MTKQVVIAGLDKELVELVVQSPEYTCKGVFDPVDVGETLGMPWLGSEPEWPAFKKRSPDIQVIIGLDLPSLRQKLAGFYGEPNIVGVRASSAKVSHFSRVCASAVLQSQVRIHADALVGFGCKINHDAVIHHDCHVGNFCTVSPGARLLGNARVEDLVFVGAGAIVLPHVTIGQGATIGAGAVVTRDVTSGVTVVGTPARNIDIKQV